MAKNPTKAKILTKKHIARVERERQQVKWVLITSGIVVGLVVLVLLAGFLNDKFIKPNRPVAVVNGEKISVTNFIEQVRFSRANLVENAQQYYSYLSYFSEDSSYLSSFISQIQQLQSQLVNTNNLGQSVIDQMVANALIRQEAEKRGITISDDEVAKEFEIVLGYFPEGTPTATPTMELIPTSTLNALQMTAIAPTATPSITATPVITATVVPTEEPTPAAEVESTPVASEPITPTATLAPTPTATAYTEEGYKSQYQSLLDRYGQYGISEEGLKYIILSQLYRTRLIDNVLSELKISNTQEEVWARHILVATEEGAQEVLTRLANGEDWCAVAQVSTDTGSKTSCGDLGWFPKGQMVAPFEESAFSLQIGEISDPIQSDFGFHIIQVLGREERPLSITDYESLKSTKFDEWVETLRSTSEIEINDIWQANVPEDPTLPDEIVQYLAQYSQNNLLQATAVP